MIIVGILSFVAISVGCWVLYTCRSRKRIRIIEKRELYMHRIDSLLFKVHSSFLAITKTFDHIQFANLEHCDIKSKTNINKLKNQLGCYVYPSVTLMKLILADNINLHKHSCNYNHCYLYGNYINTKREEDKEQEITAIIATCLNHLRIEYNDIDCEFIGFLVIMKILISEFYNKPIDDTIQMNYNTTSHELVASACSTPFINQLIIRCVTNTENYSKDVSITDINSFILPFIVANGNEDVEVLVYALLEKCFQDNYPVYCVLPSFIPIFYSDNNQILTKEYIKHKGRSKIHGEEYYLLGLSLNVSIHSGTNILLIKNNKTYEVLDNPWLKYRNIDDFYQKSYVKMLFFQKRTI